MIPPEALIQLMWSNVGGVRNELGLRMLRLAAGRYQLSRSDSASFGHMVSIQVAIPVPWALEVTRVVALFCKTHGVDRRECDLRDGCEDFPMLLQVPRWQSIVTKISETSFEVNTYHLPVSTTMEEAQSAGPPVFEDVEFSAMHMSRPASGDVKAVDKSFS